MRDIRQEIGINKLDRQQDYFDGKEKKPIFAIKGKGGTYKYVAYPKQLIFHKAHLHAFETLYGGSAGGGKSWSLLWDAYIFASQHPGTRCLILRRTYPELEKSLILYSKKMFDGSMGRYNEKNRRWMIFTKGTPSIIEFGHCKNEADVYHYHSAQYDGVYFDELTTFTEFQYTYLLTRLRPNVEGIKPFVKSATNPGNIGHGWVKRRWKLGNRSYDYKIYKEVVSEDVGKILKDLKLDQAERLFVPAKVYDNKFIMDNDPNYVARLLASPYRAQLLDGDWGVFSGQAFPEFNVSHHCCQKKDIPSDWVRTISVDFGYGMPSAIYWHAYDKESQKVYTYRELYIQGVKDRQQALKVLALSANEKIDMCIIDSSAFVAGSNGISIAEVFQEVFKNKIIVRRSNRDRVSGKMRVHDYLSMNEKKEFYWQIDSSCKNLIRTLPDLVISEKNNEDVEKGKQEDHAYDSCRYYLMSLPALKFKFRPDSNNVIKRGIDIASQREWRRVAKKYWDKDDKQISYVKGLEGYD